MRRREVPGPGPRPHRTGVPGLPGPPARASHDYVRHGTSCLFAALDLATGRVIGALHTGHRATGVPGLPQSDRRRAARRPRHAPGDGQRRDPQAPRGRALAAHPPRFVPHFTPTSALWLNHVERCFAELTTKKLRRGTHTSVRQLNTDIRAWIDTWNEITRDPTSGPRPPTKSSNPSATTADALMTHDTSDAVGVGRAPPCRRRTQRAAARWVLTQPGRDGCAPSPSRRADVTLGEVEDVAGNQLDGLDHAHGVGCRPPIARWSKITFVATQV